MSDTIAIRLAHPDEAPAVRRLALLDDARPLRGPVLLGLVDGEPHAAIALDDDRHVADPFVRTAELVELLHLRARAVREAEAEHRAIVSGTGGGVTPRLELAA